MGWMNKDFTGFLVIYKLMRGRVKNVTVHKETDSILEPDPNYDCHTSKYTLSQVYVICDGTQILPHSFHEDSILLIEFILDTHSLHLPTVNINYKATAPPSFTR